MLRQRLLQLAATGLRMPIAADLVLHQHSDAAAVRRDGERLGEVIAATARRFRTPLAIALMDLMIEKTVVLELLGVPATAIDKYHLPAPPTAAELAALGERLPVHESVCWRATCDAIAHVARDPELLPIGMVIGPLSLVVKLVDDPITRLYQAGRAADLNAPEHALLMAAFDLASTVIAESIRRQAAAGAVGIVMCEPAASTAYLSPRQIARGGDLLERFVLSRIRPLVAEMRAADVELVFHCCGELTESFIDAFVTLQPAMLSLGSSVDLPKIGQRVPPDIVLYGNLPSRLFYSDEKCPTTLVAERSRDLLREMRALGHPFILGTECDVLDVPEARERIWSKVETMMKA